MILKGSSGEAASGKSSGKLTRLLRAKDVLSRYYRPSGEHVKIGEIGSPHDWQQERGPQGRLSLSPLSLSLSSLSLSPLSLSLLSLSLSQSLSLLVSLSQSLSPSVSAPPSIS